MQNLRKVRRKNGITQVQLQMELQIDQTTLSKYETGERLPSLEHLLKLAGYFGTSVDYLLDLTDEEKPYPRKRG